MGEETHRPRITLLYLGYSPSEDGLLGHLWYDLTGIENDGAPLPKQEESRRQLFGSKKRGGVYKNLLLVLPGTIYSFEQSENGVYGKSGQYIGRWQCKDDVTAWCAKANAIERAAELAATAAKENKRHLDWEALEPFRKAYNDCLNYRQQQMLLAQVVQRVTKWKKGDDE
jgi:hypothetical protein